MKKFYISIFTAVFLLSYFISSAQVTYNSIADGNPNGYTFDDPRFWVDGVPPPVSCTNCTIRIFSSVKMVGCCGLTTTKQGALPAALTPQFVSSPPYTFGVKANDGAPITFGMKFLSSQITTVTGVRYYKMPLTTGVHVGVLYDYDPTFYDDNTLVNILGTTTFTTETASGWQSADFATPITIAANHAYVIAVYSPSGDYVSNWMFFPPTNVVNPNTGVISSKGDVATDPNGVFQLDPGGVIPAYPITPFASSNYYVDVEAVIDGAFLNERTFTTSTINVYGNGITFDIRTFVHLVGSTLIMGNDPTSTQTLLVNDQITVDDASQIILANQNTQVNANNDNGYTIHGNLNGVDGDPPTASIFNLFTPPKLIGGVPYSWILNSLAYGTATQNFAQYNINCSGTPPHLCASGIVYGPAQTQPNATINALTFAVSTTLPVELVQFLANKQSDGSVSLVWATSQETNAGYYDVERSGDQADWIKIGTVKAKGNSSVATNYNFVDKLPVDGGGYYRLKMVDLDGKFKYSKTVAVTSEGDDRALVVYSNPFTDMIRLKVNVKRAQKLNISVSDMLGRTTISQVYQAKSGDNFVNLQPKFGGTGTYVLKIHGDSYDQTVKLQKQ